MQLPIRENFGLMPHGTDITMYLVLIPFVLVFIYGVYLRLISYDGFKSIKFLLNPALLDTSLLIRNVILQIKIMRYKISGFMHIGIMYGTIILFFGTLLIFIENDFFRFFNIKILSGGFYLLYEFLLDLFGLLFIIGLIIAIRRRVGSLKLKRLREKKEYFATLLGLLFIGVSGFIIEGIRIYITNVAWAKYSFFGWTISELIKMLRIDRTVLLFTYQSLWWIHALTAFSLLAAVPYTNLIHSFLAAFNTSYKRIREPVIYVPSTPFRILELDAKPELEIKTGFKNVAELDTNHRIAIDSCMDCGRCEESCPATSSGTLLSPRNVIQKLRAELRYMPHGNIRDIFATGILSLEEIYACTTCGACLETCPADINPLDYLFEARRAVANMGKLNKQVARIIANLIRTKNPFGLPRSLKESSINELKKLGAKTIDEFPEAEYIYWLGCMALYDERVKNVAKKIVKILIKNDVSFALLGPEEVCTGDPARRIGEEGRYQELAYQNIRLLSKYPDKTIITHCPHCFNIFKNEYRDLGIKLKIIHHTQLLSRLVSNGKIKPIEGLKITFHDACYLSRINKIVEEPRKALSCIGLNEMNRHGKETFCCGAGGGNYWYEVKRNKKESVLRIEEAISTGADVLVVECPFCLVMLEDAVKTLGINKLKILELSEVFKTE